MAANIEDIVAEFIEKGYEEQKIRDEILAGRTNGKMLSMIHNDLRKRWRPVEKKICVPVPNDLGLQNTNELKSKFPLDYDLNDYLVPRLFEVRHYNKIKDKYFLEDEEKIEEMFAAHIQRLSLKFKQKYGVEVSRLTESSENELFVVGRLYVEERNDRETFFLEDSSGKIQLNLENVSNYAIFPGQVIMIKGISDSYTLKASEIYAETFENSPDCLTSQHKILIGLMAGPFSAPLHLSDNHLDYSVFLSCLNDLMKKVNILIIIGPFVDSENEVIKSGNLNIPSLNIVDGTYEDIFLVINQIINQNATENQCQVLYVPHIREVSHVFPLPMPGLTETFDTNIECSTSPCLINIDGIPIHIVPYDILKEINSNLSVKTSVPLNKIQTSVKNFLHQFCCMPLIPNIFPVEYSKFDKFCYDHPPKILITTSVLGLNPEINSGVLTFRVPSFNELLSDKFGHYMIMNISKGLPNFFKGVGIKHFLF